MYSKLNVLETKFEEVTLQLQKPDITSNQNLYRNLMKEHSDLDKIVSVFRDFKKKKNELEESKVLLTKEQDADLRDMLKDEVRLLETLIVDMEDRLKILLIPKDPNDEKNIILEIRAGAGGDEASLFVEEIFRAYTHYANAVGWKVSMMSSSSGNVGGFKEVIALISGESVYSKLKLESGVHRVQRVPETETQGRVHTSTITVAVIPEQEESEVKINQNDIRIDVTRSQGSGGQSVNTTDSAVRVTHLPTGIIVYCQQGKSQLANKETAMKILYARLVALDEEKRRKEASDTRLSQIGTGDRSERIRTYNFPQSRVTDHRIGFTTHQIIEIMNGNLDILISPLITHYQTEALKNQNRQ